ncbi:MAG: HesA/MoeB/ThiF family protein [Candidatus Asgardarchaeia archaeon]
MLNDEERIRYSRQIVLPYISLEGQEKIKRAKVAVIGVGGLGWLSSMQITAMGVGEVRVVDRDVVELSNLHRQLIYKTSDLGYSKAEIAKKRLEELNPSVKVLAFPLSINEENVYDIIKGVDVVIDGLDRFKPRYVVNKACVDMAIPYVYGAAIQTHGVVSTIIPGKTPCLNCVYPNVRDESIPSCEIVGVFTPVIGITSSIQTTEAIKLILGKQPSLAGRVLYIDATDLSFESIKVLRNPSCSVCSEVGKGRERKVEEVIQSKIIELCGNNSFMVLSRIPENIDLNEAYDILLSEYKVKKKGRHILEIELNDKVKLNLFSSGNCVIRGVNSKDEAEEIYSKILKKIVKSAQ